MTYRAILFIQPLLLCFSVQTFNLHQHTQKLYVANPNTKYPIKAGTRLQTKQRIFSTRRVYALYKQLYNLTIELSRNYLIHQKYTEKYNESKTALDRKIQERHYKKYKSLTQKLRSFLAQNNEELKNLVFAITAKNLSIDIEMLNLLFECSNSIIQQNNKAVQTAIELYEMAQKKLSIKKTEQIKHEKSIYRLEPKTQLKTLSKEQRNFYVQFTKKVQDCLFTHKNWQKTKFSKDEENTRYLKEQLIKTANETEQFLQKKQSIIKTLKENLHEPTFCNDHTLFSQMFFIDQLEFLTRHVENIDNTVKHKTIPEFISLKHKIDQKWKLLKEYIKEQLKMIIALTKKHKAENQTQ